MPRPQVITAKVIIEPGSESAERTKNYVIQTLKSSARNIRDGTVVIALYDEKDNLIGIDMTGQPSESMQVMFDDLLEDLEGDPPRP